MDSHEVLCFFFFFLLVLFLFVFDKLRNSVLHLKREIVILNGLCFCINPSG